MFNVIPEAIKPKLWEHQRDALDFAIKHLTDRVQICRSARGSSRELGRRYVGMINGRVRKELSEEERRSFEPEVFVSWANDVARIMKSSVASSNAIPALHANG
jgi:hypothetical protein